ncbi:hypothetical protein G6L37_03900 [Agrobacterium rubi]|nr:hypothetical protein [Agrobacterium rubi]NTF24493.1 hypothetical protein [Agrobacterium rubi]
MSVDKDSKDEDLVSPVERPPVVSEALWLLIPPASRIEYRKKAALGLRRGIHPETTIAELLERHEACDIGALRRAMAAYDGNEYDEEDDDHVDAEVVPEPQDMSSDESQQVAARSIRQPLWPFGVPGYRRGDMPIGEIGSILHYERGFDAPTAAEFEWLILRAIARDPLFVRKDMANLRLLGCDLPSDVVGPIRNAALFECDCVVADIRRRQAEGDPGSIAWLDTEAFVL